MKVAILHYWVVNHRGGERVVDAICALYPQANLFTHVLDKQALKISIDPARIQTSFINKLPLAKRYYRHMLPLMPAALHLLDLREYDLIISSESGPAKGIIKRPDAVHLCYCHSPMRYLYDQFEEYAAEMAFFPRIIFSALAPGMRFWDRCTSRGVDAFAANSHYVRKRIERVYGRTAEVIHPPVDIAMFNAKRSREEFYLAVSALVPYKKMDLIVSAMAKMGKPLVVIGEGPDLAKIMRIAGPSVKLLGYQSDEVVRDHMERCRAFIFAADEDFGIAPVEAQAAGAPVICYGKGGVLETVLEGRTGIFFRDQTEAALMGAIREFENRFDQFDANQIRRNSERFTLERFKSEFGEFARREIERAGSLAL